MKKFFSLLLCYLIIISVVPSVVYAEECNLNYIIKSIQEYNELVSNYDSNINSLESIMIISNEVFVNGNNTGIEADLQTIDNTVMISLDTLCEYADAEYSSNEKKTTGYSNLLFEDKNIWFNESSGVIDIIDGCNDEFAILEHAPVVDNEEVIVPLYDFANVLGYEVVEENGDYLLTRPYQTKRLLISSKEDIDSFGAVEEIRDEANNITILQFENESDAIEANEHFNSLKGVSSEPDMIMSTCDEDANQLIDVLETKSAHRDPNASECIRIDDMNDYLAKQELSKVTVAVIDTGVCSTHPDLKDRVTSASVNFSKSEQEDSEDDNGHGTHVSGIVLDNTLDNVDVLAVKVLDSHGEGTIYEIVQGMNYAAEQGVKAMNLSLGAYGKSDLMTETVKSLTSNGISIVVAAGNSNWFADEFTPAGIEECITVGAVTDKKTISGFSNKGHPIDISAPGVGIYSTWHQYKDDKGYRPLSGTSMASPFVAATVGMLISYDSSYTPEYIHNTIYSNSQNGPHSNGSGSIMEDGSLWKYGVLDCAQLIDVDRATEPKANYKSGYYSDYLDVELYSDEPNAEIYYTTDGSIASKENGILYTKPIHLEYMTRLHMISYVEGKEKSLSTFRDLFVVNTVSEESIQIDDRGYITGYTPDESWTGFARMPEKVNGIPVAGVAERAFRKDESLKLLWLPETCKVIEKQAFDNCQNLLYVTAEGITEIRDSAFSECINVKAIKCSNLEKIESRAFYKCFSIINVDYPKLTVIPDYAFYRCCISTFNLGKVTTIGDYAFVYNWFTDFDFSAVESIGDYSFEACVYLKEILAPKLKKLGIRAFGNCENLYLVNLTSMDGTIPEKCFQYCYELTYPIIPNVTRIEYCAFEDCFEIREVVMNKCEFIGSYAFTQSKKIEKIELDAVETLSGFTEANIESLSLPNCKYLGGIKSKTLKYLDLPKCEWISSGISAPQLISANLPNLKRFGMEGIEHSATKYFLFLDCDNLVSIDLPNFEEIVGYGKIFYYTGNNASSRNFQIKRINVPYLSTVGGGIRLYCNYLPRDVSVYKDLPKESSSEKLTAEFTGRNITYQWYYSETGESDSFEVLNGCTQPTIYPNNDGYYYIKCTQDDEGEILFAETSVCHFTKNPQPKEKKLVVTGNETFSVYANGKTYTPKKSIGSAYTVDITAEENSVVTVSTDSDSFVSWIGNDNRMKSNIKDYSFKITDDTELLCNLSQARYVNFYNSNGNLISSNKYYLFREKDMPEAPSMYGYEFTGWSMTASEIYSEILKGKSVSVYAQYKKPIKYHKVYIYGGEVSKTDSDTDNGANQYRELSTVTLSPIKEYAESFQYWKDTKNNIISFDPNYSFYVTNDICLVAFYGEKVIEETSTNITSVMIDKDNSKITFVANRDVPIDLDVISHGIIMTNNTEITDEDFVIGADGVLKGTSVTTANRGTYTLYKSGVKSGDIWLAKSYVIYEDANGRVYTRYSPIYTAIME